MLTKATSAFVEGRFGEEAEIRVTIIPGDAHQHDLLTQLTLADGDLERVGGQFVITLRLKRPNPRYEVASGDSRTDKPAAK